MRLRELVTVLMIVTSGRQRHVMHGAVLNTRLRDHFLSNRRNVFVVAAHHYHLNAAIVRGVHMHARNDGFVVLVLLFCVLGFDLFSEPGPLRELSFGTPLGREYLFPLPFD